MPINDANFPVRISSPLKSKLLVESVSGEEHIGRPFVFYLNLLSEESGLEFDKVVGQRVTVTLQLASGERYFEGYITEFTYAPPREGFARYQATIRPWFWFLTQTADCRIFQEKTVPDIIKEVFGDNGMSDFDVRLTGKYRKWEYCVQYRESDFNFISRLMEQEGIYYYFEHHKDKHVMVLADDNTAHDMFTGHDTVSFSIQPDRNKVAGHFETWTATQSIMPLNYAVHDFNFQTPKVNLLSKSSEPSTHAYPFPQDPEIFDYPGEYSQTSDGVNYVKIRLQELQCQKERLRAGGNCRGVAVGYKFTLENHFRDDQNKAYLVVSVTHSINNAPFLTGEGSEADLYRCEAEVIDFQTPFRAPRQTPKPIVQGPQSAIVVGQSGEEIFTDEFGRVKVQFHWDRYGKKDENSSCWVRVSQVWAGAKWGAMHIPRIGQEVIVSFMEGDPDRPVITGRVYNADYMPPYTLPENKTQSGLKSRSSKDATPDNFNELRFEDKIGEEHIFLQAEKDLTALVKDTRKETICSEKTAEPNEVVEELEVFGARKQTIHGDDSLTVDEGEVGRKIEIVDGSYDLLVKKKDYLLTVDTGKSTTLIKKGNMSTEVSKGNMSTKVSKGNMSTEVSKGNKTTEVKLGNISTKAAAGKITVEAMQSIELKVGPSSIKIDMSGVTIKGGMIKVEGTAMAEMKAPMTTVKGDGVLTLKGGVTLIN